MKSPRRTTDEDYRRARDFVLRCGWNSTCFQILNPGIELWFSPSNNGVVGYVLRKHVRVVAGSPVCAEGDLDHILAEWEEEARSKGHRVCYFGAEGRLRSRLAGVKGYSTVSLGAQPSWNPQDWNEIFKGDRNLRAQRYRATNKGVIVREWQPSQASTDARLKSCLANWLNSKGLPPMHFLVEPETLERLEGRRIFVAEKKDAVVGFLVLSPVPERNGWLTEQFPRARNAPNGTVEILMDEAIRAVAKSGSDYVTMGIVPLSLHGLPAARPNPGWLKFLMGWVRAHGRRFYNFDGLDRFKSKFRPQQWEPIYVISKEEHFSFRSLLAIAAAFSDGSPTSAVARGLCKAIGQEIFWLREAAQRMFADRIDVK